MTQTEYDLTQNQLTQLYDCVNVLTDDAKNDDLGNRVVEQAAIDLHAEVNRVTPSSWWVDRDEEFDEFRRDIRECSSIEKRGDLVVDFCNDLTDRLFASDLSLEP